MKRNAMESLVRWKNDEERKPMVLKGARQVGKTWIMKEFGRQYYENQVYFNFDEEVEVKGGEDKSAPSFKKYVQEKEPKTALRFSKRGYRKDGNVTNVPLYLARKIKELM